MSRVHFEPWGFVWGPMRVTRVMEIRGAVVVEIRGAKTRVEVYVSAQGRSVRVFIDGKEAGR